ncbi:MAG: hypothetical protein R2941_01115 [Desulfobacterales bacterium]
MREKILPHEKDMVLEIMKKISPLAGEENMRQCCAEVLFLNIRIKKGPQFAVNPVAGL